MSKITIIESNANDKDQVRNYFVKGERGYSAYDLYVQEGGTMTEEEWLDAFLNADNYYTKTETGTLLSAKINTSDIVDNLTSTDTDKPLSAKQGKALKDLFTPVSFKNNVTPTVRWEKDGDDYSQMYKIGNLVIISGSFSSADANNISFNQGDVIFTIPSSVRPEYVYTTTFTGKLDGTNEVHGNIQVKTNGEVIISSPSATSNNYTGYIVFTAIYVV